jgi:hypothetical protein
MKRIIVNLILIIILFLTLISCSGQNYNDNENSGLILSNSYAVWNNCVFGGNKYLDMNNGELSYVCGDPLCTHKNASCPAYGLKQVDFMVIPINESKSAPFIYYNTKIISFINDAVVEQYWFEKYDMATNTRTQIYQTEGMINTNWSYDNINHIIYYTQLVDDGNGETINAYCMLDVEKGISTQITTSDLLCPVTDISGRTLYLTYYVDNSIYTINLDSETPALENTGLYGTVRDSYIYYTEDIETYTATAPSELDLSLLKNEYNNVLTDTSLNIYRVPLDDTAAEPELVVSGISKRESYRIDGNYMYSVKCDPSYIGSYFATNNGNVYDIGASDIPSGAYLYNIFSVSSGILNITDLRTLETQTVETDGVDLSMCLLMTDSGIIGAGSMYDKEFIMNYIHENKLSGMQYIYGTWYIPFEGDGNVKSENAVKIDWYN